MHAEFEGRYETDRNKVEVLRGLEFPEISRIMVSLAAKIEDLAALQYKHTAIEESDNLTEHVLKKIEDLIQNVTEGTRRTRGACDSRTEAPRRRSGGLRTPTAPLL